MNKPFSEAQRIVWARQLVGDYVRQVGSRAWPPDRYTDFFRIRIAAMEACQIDPEAIFSECCRIMEAINRNPAPERIGVSRRELALYLYRTNMAWLKASRH